MRKESLLARLKLGRLASKLRSSFSSKSPISKVVESMEETLPERPLSALSLSLSPTPPQDELPYLLQPDPPPRAPVPIRWPPLKPGPPAIPGWPTELPPLLRPQLDRGRAPPPPPPPMPMPVPQLSSRTAAAEGSSRRRRPAPAAAAAPKLKPPSWDEEGVEPQNEKLPFVHFIWPPPEEPCPCPYIHFPRPVVHGPPPPGKTPIARLPSELLYTVFMLLYSEAPDVPRSREALHVALSLSQVCRRWREVTLSVPLFWSHISATRMDEQTLLRTRTYLSRVGSSQPLSIELLYPDHFPSTSSELRIAESLLSLLLKRSHRWESFRLVTSAGLQELFSRLSPAELPILRRLELAPVVWEPLEYIPWHQLAYLSLDCPMSGDSVLELARRCPKLEYLNLRKITGAPLAPMPDNSDSDSGSESDDAVIILKELKTLSFSTDDTPNELYERISLPALQTLSLATSSFFSAQLDPRVIDAFLRRSGCTLLSFTLADPSITDGEVIQWLRLPSLQSLRHLNIQNPPVSSTVLEALCLVEWNPPPPLLSLEEIELAKCVARDDVLLDLIQSRVYQRRGPGGVFSPCGSAIGADGTRSQLRSVKATLDSGMNVGGRRADFKGLRKMGVSVEIRYEDVVEPMDSISLPLSTPFDLDHSEDLDSNFGPLHRGHSPGLFGF